MKIAIESDASMKAFGERLGALLSGGEVLELVGDVGAGKTTFTKGLARGLGIEEEIQSPTFTINRLYEARDNLTLAHYDFYRLNEPGIMSLELAETIQDKAVVTVLEWADIVDDVLPKDHLRVVITPDSLETRQLVISAGGESSRQLMEKLG